MRNVGPGMGANVPVTGPNGGTAAPGAAAPAPTATLPPERILFAGTATSLKLIANRPAIFALYALPIAILFTGILPLQATAADFLLHFLPYFLATNVAVSEFARGHLHDRCLE